MSFTATAEVYKEGSSTTGGPIGDSAAINTVFNIAEMVNKAGVLDYTWF
ncbi:MAG: hypothetical protein MI922_24525 [Bacteroidales bacterium]|nr:hypothetical protein [Bacteroidales bacterium]